MSELRNSSPNSIATALFNTNVDPFETMKELKNLVGPDTADAILDLKAPFTLSVDRGQATTEEARTNFENALRKNADVLKL